LNSFNPIRRIAYSTLSRSFHRQIVGQVRDHVLEGSLSYHPSVTFNPLVKFQLTICTSSPIQISHLLCSAKAHQKSAAACPLLTLLALPLSFGQRFMIISPSVDFSPGKWNQMPGLPI
jgi:hypothetical protein